MRWRNSSRVPWNLPMVMWEPKSVCVAREYFENSSSMKMAARVDTTQKSIGTEVLNDGTTVTLVLRSILELELSERMELDSMEPDVIWNSSLWKRDGTRSWWNSRASVNPWEFLRNRDNFWNSRVFGTRPSFWNVEIYIWTTWQPLELESFWILESFWNKCRVLLSNLTTFGTRRVSGTWEFLELAEFLELDNFWNSRVFGTREFLELESSLELEQLLELEQFLATPESFWPQWEFFGQLDNFWNSRVFENSRVSGTWELGETWQAFGTREFVGTREFLELEIFWNLKIQRVLIESPWVCVWNTRVHEFR